MRLMLLNSKSCHIYSCVCLEYNNLSIWKIIFGIRWRNMHWNRSAVFPGALLRSINTGANRSSNKVPKNAKSHSSHKWLTRQLKDPFVELAQTKNYRCRSAFKLLEINEKNKILIPGHTVIDCGAAPGSWTQVAVETTNADGHSQKQAKGFVVSLDLLAIHPIQGAHILGHSNFTETKTKDRVRQVLDGRKINCVLSDMAPNATGIRSLDQDKIMDLCYSVLDFAIKMSSTNASLLVKVWDNGGLHAFEKDLLRYYEYVKHIKPKASRDDSAEKFILAKNFVELKSG